MCVNKTSRNNLSYYFIIIFVYFFNYKFTHKIFGANILRDKKKREKERIIYVERKFMSSFL